MYSTHLVIQVQVPHLGCPVLKKQKNKTVKIRKKEKNPTGVLVSLHTVKIEINNVNGLMSNGHENRTRKCNYYT